MFQPGSGGSGLYGLTCYDILGLQRHASAQEVRQAYIQAARRHHPDVNPDDSALAAVRFRTIQKAYECLQDPVRRGIYDRELDIRRWSQNWAENDNPDGRETDLFARTRKNLERMMRLMVKQRQTD